VPHETALISTIAVCLALAFVGGYVAFRLKLPPLVGYLLAGIAAGPFTPGFVADAKLAPELAEIGVILLMFGVGMHFSVRDLLAVRSVAVSGAIVQMAVATALGLSLAHLWGWSFGGGVVFGLALSVASTVVLMKALESRGGAGTTEGRIAVGWLIVEDLLMVLVIVLLPALCGSGLSGSSLNEFSGTEEIMASSPDLLATLGLTLGKLALFVGVMFVVGARLLPWTLHQVSRTGSRELFTLGVIAVSLGVAYFSAHLFGVSFALGAFCAGVVVNGSRLSDRAAADIKPFEDAFAALFFVAVGMLFDPAILVREPLRVLAVLGIIVLGKSIAALGIVLLLKQPMRTALTVSAALAQIGEFSFILVGLGVSLGLLPQEGQSLILAGALLSITLNPIVFRCVARSTVASTSQG
jgi:CPA2 family monovalent cation:H+ antiporter-2